MVVELAPELLEILACPNCHSSLAVDHDRDELVCVAADCGLAYPVRDGIPVMLIDEARRPNGQPGTDPGGRPEAAAPEAAAPEGSDAPGPGDATSST